MSLSVLSQYQILPHITKFGVKTDRLPHIAKLSVKTDRESSKISDRYHNIDKAETSLD